MSSLPPNEERAVRASIQHPRWPGAATVDRLSKVLAEGAKAAGAGEGALTSALGYAVGYMHGEGDAFEVARLRAALTTIAAWNEGPEVTSSFDEPHAARIARAALEAEPGRG